jgi:hypothetical protein
MKKKQSPIEDILFLSISSFVVVVAWVGFNIYHSYVTTTITPDLQIQIEPIQPDFDIATIQTLKSRKQVAPITKLLNKTPLEPTPAATTQQITPTQTITPTNNIPVVIEGE